MGDFAKYLIESAQQYDYRIKVAGELDKDFSTKLETCLQKFEVAKMSAGKSTPIQEAPLDFPMFKNTNVTIYELTTNYPVSAFEMQKYIAEYMKLAQNQVVVRKPNEPTEEYQADMADKKDESEFKSVLQDVEYKDTPEVPKEKEFGDKANQSLFKQLLKDKKEKIEAEKKETAQPHMDKEEKGTPSALKAAHKGPIKGNPHPDPKRK
tara:strand:+ start:675 stop:1298 length:624 start_codon:yes stop_codon:yes gene_type:complete